MESRTPRVTRIRPVHGWIHVNAREVWQYRDLLFLLSWRDITVRYKQTILGPAWVILQPILTMVVFSVVFGRLAKMPSDGLPYPVFSFAALVPWGLFATSLTQASNSLIASANLVRKVYFPRLVVPISCIGSALIDFSLSLAILFGMMIWYGITPGIRVAWLPAFALLAAATALGAGLWASALSVRFRDIRLAVPYLIQVWFFASPVTYPSSLLPAEWRQVYFLNPMAGVVEGFRWALLGSGSPPGPEIGWSILTTSLLLASGAVFFRRMESTFGDLI